MPSGFSPSSAASPAPPAVATVLLPLVPIVFIAFLVVGLAMPVLPLHVHDGLGMDTFVVGLVAGAQFAASLVSRFWSGRHADSKGGKRALVVDLLLATAAGLFYELSLRFAGMPRLSVAILLLGRALLGGAESFVITGATGWGLALAGPQNAGKVIAWIGMALYVGYAVGAPAGTLRYASHGFGAIALVTLFTPLASLLLALPLRHVAPQAHTRSALRDVLGTVWVPGIGCALASLGYGAIITFIALLFSQRGWPSAWLALTGFSVALIVARLCFSHLPDRIGGARVALLSALIEVIGLLLIGFAPGVTLALAGATLTGFGYSLVFPGFGVEAVRRAPPHSRALAMGAYTAFLDLALGLSSPALGWIAGKTGLASVFLISALVVLSAAATAMRLLSNKEE